MPSLDTVGSEVSGAHRAAAAAAVLHRAGTAAKRGGRGGAHAESVWIGPWETCLARHRLQASDFARLRLDGPAWRSQILQGTNQTSPQSVSRWDKQEEGSAGREEEEDEQRWGRRNPRRNSEREVGRAHDGRCGVVDGKARTSGKAQKKLLLLSPLRSFPSVAFSLPPSSSFSGWLWGKEMM